jgi:hypothetical protein
MNPLLKGSSADVELQARAMSADERRLEQLIDRLPSGFRSAVRSLRRPSGRWLRIPAGVLLTFGGALGFLPIVGFWMLPIGLVLLADDVQLLRSAPTCWADCCRSIAGSPMSGWPSFSMWPAK